MPEESQSSIPASVVNSTCAMICVTNILIKLIFVGGGCYLFGIDHSVAGSFLVGLGFLAGINYSSSGKMR